MNMPILASPDRTQLSMLVFMVLTAVQIVVFVVHPVLVYGDAAVAMDRPPHFVFFRLIGVKEVGLMVMYAAALGPSSKVNTFFCFVSAVGRLSTICYMTWVVFKLGGPTVGYVGIVQDVVFGTWTMYTCVSRGYDAQSSNGSSGVSLPSFSLLCIVTITGLAEAWHGFRIMLQPVQSASEGFGEVVGSASGIENWGHGPLHLGFD